MPAHLQACRILWNSIRPTCSPNLSDPVSYLANQQFVFISLSKFRYIGSNRGCSSRDVPNPYACQANPIINHFLKLKTDPGVRCSRSVSNAEPFRASRTPLRNHRSTCSVLTLHKEETFSKVELDGFFTASSPTFPKGQ
jgi:hypothetical protein